MVSNAMRMISSWLEKIGFGFFIFQNQGRNFTNFTALNFLNVRTYRL